MDFLPDPQTRTKTKKKKANAVILAGQADLEGSIACSVGEFRISHYYTILKAVLSLRAPARVRNFPILKEVTVQLPLRCKALLP